MFIYQFMSGLVRLGEEGKAEEEGENEEEVYDPHAHRVIQHPTNYSDTMIHLLKGSIGAGILAMPEATKRVGIIASIPILLFIGAYATYAIHMLIAAQYHLCKRMRRGYIAYPKAMMLLVETGPPGTRCLSKYCYYFVDTVLIIWQLGLCCVYCVFVAKNFEQVMSFYGYTYDVRLHLLALLPPLILVNIVKNLKVMTPISTISNIVTMFGLILCFFYLIEDDIVVDSDKLRMKGLMEIPTYIGTALFALEAVGVVLALEYNIDEPKKFVGWCGLFTIGMIIILALYTLVGIFGYLKYGENIESTITLNLPPNEKKAQVAKIAIACAIFLSFPLQNYVAYEILWRKLKKRLKPTTKKPPVDYALRVILVVIPWAVAVAIPQLGPFISLFGAFCLSLLAIVFPAFMDLCWYYSSPRGFGVCRYRLVRDILMMIIGFFCLFSGCYTSVIEIIENW